MNRIRSISFIGAGNVAWHLALTFYKKGIKINQVYSRTSSSAVELAQKVNAGFTTDVSKIKPEADLFIVALTDDIIGNIPEMVEFDDKLVIHTAGSVSISVFEGKLKNFGVLYPLQTFSKKRQINMSDVPFCIEARWAVILSMASRFPMPLKPVSRY